MPPLRILIVAPSLRFTGGQSVQALRILEELRQLPGINVDLLEVDPQLPGPLAALQRIKYVRTVVTESLYLLNLLVKVRRYDVIHAFSAGYWSFLLAPAPAILLGKLFGRKTVLNYHNGTLADHLSKFPNAVRLMRMADRIVTPSGFLVDVFAQFGMAATSIFNIVDTKSFPYRERSQPKPVFFSNRGMEPLYNIPCTLRAFAILQQKYAQASLRLAHDGPLRPQLERLAQELRLNHVEFLGFVDQQRMRQLYDQADIYLMSPDIDNMPLSILECYACGLPFVSTAAGGVPFIVEDGRTGLLAPVNDHAALAGAALRLLEEPGLAQALTSAGRKECEYYQGPEVAGQWVELYRALMQRSAMER